MKELSWNAILSMTKAELDLISDVEIISLLTCIWFLKLGIRCSVSYNPKRYSIIDLIKDLISIYRLMIQNRSKAYYVPRRK